MRQVGVGLSFEQEGEERVDKADKVAVGEGLQLCALLEAGDELLDEVALGGLELGGFFDRTRCSFLFRVLILSGGGSGGERVLSALDERVDPRCRVVVALVLGRDASYDSRSISDLRAGGRAV